MTTTSLRTLRPKPNRSFFSPFIGHYRFYEKVVKVKDDVAAILNFFPRAIIVAPGQPAGVCTSAEANPGGPAPPRRSPWGKRNRIRSRCRLLRSRNLMYPSRSHNAAFTDLQGLGGILCIDPLEDQVPEIPGLHPLVPRFYPHS